MLLIGGIGQGISGAGAVEAAAERIAGFHPARSVAVEQAVDLIRRGDYSLALLRLTAEKQGHVDAGAGARIQCVCAAGGGKFARCVSGTQLKRLRYASYREFRVARHPGEILGARVALLATGEFAWPVRAMQ